MDSAVFTKWMNCKMKAHGLSQREVLDTFHHGRVEQGWDKGFKSIKQYPGREIGVFWSRDPNGEYVLRSCWKRLNRW